jgi:hypothetical protein
MRNNILKKAMVFTIIIVFIGAIFSSATGFKLRNNNIYLIEKQDYKNIHFPSNLFFSLPIENKALEILSNNFNYNIGQSIMQTDDNGYIVTGFKQEFDIWNPNSDIIKNTLLIKNDVNGNREWKKSFSFMSGNMGYSVQQTYDKGYIIGGSASTSDTTYALLLKSDEQGNQEWKNTYEGIGNAIAYSVQQTSDNGFILTGSSSYSQIENNSFLLLLKTDEAGNLEWYKTFYFDIISMGQSIIQTDDMGYIITGYTGEFKFEPGSLIFDLKAVVLKTNVNGTEEWRNTFDIMDITIGYSIHSTTDGGYIIGGTAVELSEYTVFGFLLKIDEMGNKQWQKTFKDQYGNSVQQTADNGYILGGSVLSSSNTYAMLLKTDETGNKIWTKTYKGLGISLCNSVQQTIDNGFILTGATASSIYSYKIYVFILKTDQNGNEIWSQSLKRNIPKSGFKYNLITISQNKFLHDFIKYFLGLKKIIFISAIQ